MIIADMLLTIGETREAVTLILFSFHDFILTEPAFWSSRPSVQLLNWEFAFMEDRKWSWAALLL